MDFKPRSLNNPFSRSPPREVCLSEDGENGSVITLQEWQGWGTTSPLPTIVTRIADDLKDLEKDNNTQMTFGGKGGKLQVSSIPKWIKSLKGLFSLAGIALFVGLEVLIV